jgi:uridylate kinase
MDLVIKYGGSLLFDDGTIRASRIDAMCDAIRTLVEEGHAIGLVVGGGATARSYIRGLAADYGQANKDLVAVMATRMNAMLFISRLADLAAPYPPQTYDDMVRQLREGKMIVSGGMQPGQSTNAVATLLCEAMGAGHLVNATDVDYLYDKDPQKFDDARPIEDATYAQLREIVTSSGKGAGQYELFDTVAVNNLERSHIQLHFVNGSDPQRIIRLVRGERVGTTVHE